MPKNNAHHGPSYAGLVDTSPAHAGVPEWTDPADVSRETTDEPVAEDRPKRGPGRPKGSKNKTTASAGGAAGTGGTGLA